MNSKNSRTSDPCCSIKCQRILLMKKKNNNFKVSISTWNEEFKLHNDHPPHQKFKIILNIYIKKINREKTDNLSIRMHINKVESRITLKIK